LKSAGGIHVLGEVYNGNPAQACTYQNYMTGFLNYPA
jgi:alpha-amylase